MTALAASINVEEKDGVLVDAPIAVDIVYRGAMVMNNAAGFLAPCAAEAGSSFAGISEEEVNNSGGSAGDKSCKYKRTGRYLLTGTGLAQTDVGAKVYASDDQTITKTFAANLPYVGIIDSFVSATQVWVKINPQVGEGEAAIVDATGGGTVDAEARTAINAALAVLRKERLIQG